MEFGTEGEEGGEGGELPFLGESATTGGDNFEEDLVGGGNEKGFYGEGEGMGFGGEEERRVGEKENLSTQTRRALKSTKKGVDVFVRIM